VGLDLGAMASSSKRIAGLSALGRENPTAPTPALSPCRVCAPGWT